MIPLIDSVPLSLVDFFGPAFRPLHLALALVFGLVFGSFFNVCIYRIPMGIALSLPPSHCYRCGSLIKWYDNIPVVSYLLLRGRCRQCGVPFSARYALIELTTETETDGDAADLPG